MPIFRVENQKLRKLHIAPLGKERELQRLLEANLPEALGLRFLASEYTTTTGGRIDTLAVDEAGCPVIIEYKRSRSDSVINQALSYLLWLRTQKRGFFEKLMIDQLGAEVALEVGLDWSNPRVICIAEAYSRFDIDTAEVVPLRIELMRYRFYADDVFSLEPISIAEEAERARPEEFREALAPKATAPTEPLPTPESLSANANASAKSMFADLREWILTLDEGVLEKPTKLYVAYRMTRNFAEVHFGKDHLKIYLRPVDYVDPHGMISTIPAGYCWTMDRRIYVRSAQDLERAQPLIEQSYRDVL